MAALVYQALVDQGRLEPLASSLQANKYVVVGESTPTATTPQTPPTSPTTSTPAGNGPLVAVGTAVKVRAPGAQTANQSVRYAIVPGEVYATNLVVSEDIVGKDGKVLIPRGSVIQGSFRPFNVQTGNTTTAATRYVTDSIKIGNRTYAFRAISSPRLPTPPSQIDVSDSNADVQSSDAARSILSVILPKLGNAVLGTTPPTSAQTQNSDVILINPATDLDLTVRSALRLDA